VIFHCERAGWQDIFFDLRFAPDDEFRMHFLGVFWSGVVLESASSRIAAEDFSGRERVGRIAK
jgi:hypothetical protein